ncbi:hypothetical protein [Bradyrhizobium sp. ORS 375]|uniref:hypothetical protein n=1 Tax=Bradyrhizobium sp. (strain ORS 375) TaxID=566679 RepID=UPI00111253A3|nr:hypothetical protein [Bradyrhizobium sp. ORS 375]
MLAPVIDIVADQDTSVGVSGPHGLTVRGTTFVRTLKDAASLRGHRSPPQRPVTIAMRPSQCGRDGRIRSLIWGRRQQNFWYSEFAACIAPVPRTSTTPGITCRLEAAFVGLYDFCFGTVDRAKTASMRTIPTTAGREGALVSHSVIPGRAQREPGIHSHDIACGAR